jgi:hypothetical protein
MGHPSQDKELIVEGAHGIQTLLGLIVHHFEWPDDKQKAPVYLEDGKGINDILKPEYVSGKLKEDRIKTLGFVVDADTSAESRYGRFKSICSNDFPGLNSKLAIKGEIAKNKEGKRIGIWIMPNNDGNGDIETFMASLVPKNRAPILDHAIAATRKAKELGAPFKDTHTAKAHIHTYLAWQNPPAIPRAKAMVIDCLNPECASAKAFVNWFAKLFGLSVKKH